MWGVCVCGVCVCGVGGCVCVGSVCVWGVCVWVGVGGCTYLDVRYTAEGSC